MLDYQVVENLLTEAPDDGRAQVVNVTSQSEEQVIGEIMKIGAGLTISDVKSVIEAEKQVVCNIIAGGGAVTTPLFNAYPSIVGTFNNVDDSFDPTRHSTRINLTPGVAMREAATKIKTRKVIGSSGSAVITSAYDASKGTLNSTLTPGKGLRLLGQKLKVAGELPEVGVWFVSATDGTRTKAEAGDLLGNTPGELMVIVPALAAGSYKVEVVTQYAGGSGYLLKEARTTTLNKVLTVQ